MVEIVAKLAAYYRGCFWGNALRAAVMPALPGAQASRLLCCGERVSARR